MDFTKSIYDNRQALKRPLLAAHRGICGANIPCNSLAAYGIALKSGADIVEIDVSVSKDGQYFAFHPGMEKTFLKSRKFIKDMKADEVKSLRLYNQDGVVTHYPVPTLSEALSFLKDKAYINVDKFWMDVKGISDQIRKAGVEKQVIVKTNSDEKSLREVEKYASDFMYIPMVCSRDTVTQQLLGKVNYVGAEILFSSEQDEVISDEYIASMHEKKLLVWANSIVYNEKAVISAGHTDDIAMTVSQDDGWGWLVDKGVDIIQTDWLSYLQAYLKNAYEK